MYKTIQISLSLCKKDVVCQGSAAPKKETTPIFSDSAMEANGQDVRQRQDSWPGNRLRWHRTMAAVLEVTCAPTQGPLYVTYSSLLFHMKVFILCIYPILPTSFWTGEIFHGASCYRIIRVTSRLNKSKLGDPKEPDFGTGCGNWLRPWAAHLWGKGSCTFSITWK